MATLTLSDVNKFYGSSHAVRGVSLDIADGEFVSLVGPSGCGKSTLLRMIAGLEDISDGKISIGDAVINDISPAGRNIAMVFQNYALYPHMTVAENMSFALRLRGLPKAEIAGKVREAAKIVGMDPYLDRLPSQLSGGQRQRVAMGHAIVRDPAVFLFDEPLSNLDAKLRVQMRTEVKELHQRLATTTVYVTHDQVEAMTMADRIVVMNDGLVEQVGAPLELFDFPKNVFVASFIGSPAMNLLSGVLEDDEFVADNGPRLPLPAEASGLAGRRIVYGIRPEHLLIDAERGIPARVAVSEPFGSETQVLLRVGEMVITALFRERIVPQPEQNLSILPNVACVHLFDEATGERLGNADPSSGEETGRPVRETATRTSLRRTS